MARHLAGNVFKNEKWKMENRFKNEKWKMHSKMKNEKWFEKGKFQKHIIFKNEKLKKGNIFKNEKWKMELNLWSRQKLKIKFQWFIFETCPIFHFFIFSFFIFQEFLCFLRKISKMKNEKWNEKWKNEKWPKCQKWKIEKMKNEKWLTFSLNFKLASQNEPKSIIKLCNNRSFFLMPFGID